MECLLIAFLVFVVGLIAFTGAFLTYAIIFDNLGKPVAKIYEGDEVILVHCDNVRQEWKVDQFSVTRIHSMGRGSRVVFEDNHYAYKTKFHISAGDDRIPVFVFVPLKLI